MKLGACSSNRRTFMARAAAAYAVVALPKGLRAEPNAKFVNDPFQLGVASGEPLSDGFVIWTRIAPHPLEPERLGTSSIPVRWVVATDERLQGIVGKGTAYAHANLAHSVHVELRGLDPDRPYWYRFEAGGVTSPVGRAYTTPLFGAPHGKMRFAFASCQQYEQGYYAAYRHMVADDPKLIVHLGDYIYESSWGRQVRRHEGPTPTTLAGYRARHALYKSDPDLQAAHAHCPWIVTWDDHEVDNDYAGSHSAHFEDPAIFLKRRAAAYQAYYEHMPIRRTALPSGPDMRLYQSFTFGDLITINMVDGRQYRSDQACDDNGKGGSQTLEDCEEIFDTSRTMLGERQERWLQSKLKYSETRWNVIGQQTVFTHFDMKPGAGKKTWTDTWDGYVPSRRKILTQLHEEKVSNPIVIGGDVHSSWVTDLKPDHWDEGSPTVATEFTTTSITSHGIPYDKIMSYMPENPHVRFFDSRKRGYTLCDVTPEKWTTRMRVIEDVRDPKTGSDTRATFVIESGRPGAQSA